MLLGAAKAQQVVRRATKSTERMRILLAGRSAKGKTTSLLTLPAALEACGVTNPKIILADFDQNADELLDHPAFEVYRFGGIPGSDPETYPAAKWWMDNEVPKMENINVFITDSLTSLSLASLTTVAKDNNRIGKAPQLQDWNHEMHATQQWCLDMQNTKVSHAVITICHTHMEKDDLTGRAYNNLVLTGKLPAKLIRLFPEIYYADTVPVGRSSRFIWQTVPDPTTMCRTMLPDFRKEDGIDQDFTPIFKSWFSHQQKGDDK